MYMYDISMHLSFVTGTQAPENSRDFEFDLANPWEKSPTAGQPVGKTTVFPLIVLYFSCTTIFTYITQIPGNGNNTTTLQK